MHVCLDFYADQKCYAILPQQLISSNKHKFTARWDDKIQQ